MNKEQNAAPIFVEINSEGFAKTLSTGKVSSNFVSEIITASALSLSCEATTIHKIFETNSRFHVK